MNASRNTVYVLATLALLLVALFWAWLAPSPPGRLDAVSRENAYLLARQEALRRAAYELADEVCLQVEHDRRVLVRAGLEDPLSDLWTPVHSPPPVRGSDEAILTWLAEQSSRIQSLPPDPAASP